MAGPNRIIELRHARSYPVIVLISAVDRRIVPALRFVSRLPFAEPRALHVSIDAEETRRIAADWMALGLTWLPLHIRDASGGDVAASVRAVIAQESEPGRNITVVLPELNLPRWWHPILHRQSARRIAAQLQRAPDVTPVIVPFATDLQEHRVLEPSE